jgi:hypothetical protein
MTFLFIIVYASRVVRLEPMQRDLQYERENVGYDHQYPDGDGIKCKNYMCHWVPLKFITTPPDRFTVKLTFERVYFNGTHLESMTADDLRATLETLRDVRHLNRRFKMEDWMPLSDNIEGLSEKYHSMLDENIRGIRVRFGVDHDNEKLPGVWLVKL